MILTDEEIEKATIEKLKRWYSYEENIDKDEAVNSGAWYSAGLKDARKIYEAKIREKDQEPETAKCEAGWLINETLKGNYLISRIAKNELDNISKVLKKCTS